MVTASMQASLTSCTSAHKYGASRTIPAQSSAKIQYRSLGSSLGGMHEYPRTRYFRKYTDKGGLRRACAY